MIYIGIFTLIGLSLVGIWVYKGEKERRNKFWKPLIIKINFIINIFLNIWKIIICKETDYFFPKDRRFENILYAPGTPAGNCLNHE